MFFINAAWSFSAKPMDTEENNVMFVANDIIALLSCDMILIFSDFVPSATNRYTLGYVYLSIFYISVGVNLAIILKVIVLRIIKWYKVRKYKEEMKAKRRIIPQQPAIRPAPDVEQGLRQTV